MILVAPRVPPSVVFWLKFSRTPFLRFLCLFAAITVFSAANVWSLPGRPGKGNLLTSHFSPLTNHPGRRSA